MLEHGINTYKEDTSIVSVKTAAVGIPFFIGAWPCHTGKGYTGKPQYVTSFSEGRELGGYSAEWRTAEGKPKWSLCQALYAHFVLMAMSPAVFYNIFDPAKHKKTVPETEYAVTDHAVLLDSDTIDSEKLMVKAGENTLVRDVDFEAFYNGKGFCIELLEDGGSYGAETLSVAYETADLSSITAEDVELAVEAVEMCGSVAGVVPDLICAPGWSSDPTVAAVMAAKAPSINGIFRGKAVVDIDSSKNGASDYSRVLSVKNGGGFTSEDMIVCWPMVKSGDYLFDLSVIVCGMIAKVDSGNADCPYESPSNKDLAITGTVNAEGEEINITPPQADMLSITDGVVTVLNNNGWVLWGNYLACFPKISDVAKMFICTSRTQDWLCNTFVNTYRQYIDKPLNPPLRDAIINSFNIWLSGLTAEGKLYGGEIEYRSELNPVTSLMEGKFRLDTKAASPVPAQRIDMHIEYSVDMLEAAMNS